MPSACYDRPLQPPKTRLTRSGFRILCLALFCVLGAAVREADLLVILAGLLFGTFVLQWRLSRRMVDRLAFRRMLPSEAFAGRPFSVQIALRNPRRLLGAWLLEAADPISGVNQPSVAAEGRASVGALSAGDTRMLAYRCLIPRRGRYRWGALRVATGFPFGLTRATASGSETTELVVFPRLVRLPGGWLQRLQAPRSGMASGHQRAGNSEDDFFGLRSWQTGDSRRWIHWRTSARIDELAVRQFEQRRREQLSILVDLFGPDEAEEDEAVERVIVMAASITEQLARRPQSRLAVAVAGRELFVTRPPTPGGVRRAVLTHLATARGAANCPLAEALSMLVTAGGIGSPVVVLSTRPRDHSLLCGSGRASGRVELDWWDLSSSAMETRLGIEIGQLVREGTLTESLQE